MSKNNKLINSMLEVARRNRSNNIAQATEDLTPYVYAGVALALHRKYGWGYTRINNVFVESQRLWEEDKEDMLQRCEDETGIRLITENQARKEGLIE